MCDKKNHLLIFTWYRNGWFDHVAHFLETSFKMYSWCCVLVLGWYGFHFNVSDISFVLQLLFNCL